MKTTKSIWLGEILQDMLYYCGLNVSDLIDDPEERSKIEHALNGNTQCLLDFASSVLCGAYDIPDVTRERLRMLLTPAMGFLAEEPVDSLISILQKNEIVLKISLSKK